MRRFADETLKKMDSFFEKEADFAAWSASSG